VKNQGEVTTVMAANPRSTIFMNQRRSQRIVLAVPLEVSGVRPNGKRFTENTKTLIISAHGGLIQLREAVNKEQILTIRNLQTLEDLRCLVVDICQGQDGMNEVGVEFVDGSARFWRVSFPPVDWSSRSPEAKRYEKTPPVPTDSTLTSHEKK